MPKVFSLMEKMDIKQIVHNVVSMKLFEIVIVIA